MLCKNPYMKGIVPHGCGQCLPCRITRRRTWTHRIILETLSHTDSVFVTLTYNEEHLPQGGTLEPKDTQDWLKRLRKTIEPSKIRYFLVGEYGDNTQRPHYHAIIFGMGVYTEEILRNSWTKGSIHIGDVTLFSAQYVAGYTIKKMTSPEDERLNGRHPEFARMSLRPGLGALALPEIVSALETHTGAELLQETGDVPTSLAYGKKEYPLGRYLRKKVREKYGFKETSCPKEVLEKYKEEMQDLSEDLDFPQEIKKAIVKERLRKISYQKNLNLESKFRLYNKEKKL